MPQRDAEEPDDGTVTRERSPLKSVLPPVNPGAELFEDLAAGERYHVRRELGRGSMGEVQLCHDARIGRDVAMKVMIAGAREDRRKRARFVREARVQGQLEHPSIAPVYELGVDDHGAVFFTMKRLAGLTLKEILAGLRAGDAEVTAQFTRHRLLGAFSQTCLAVDFAHARGVVHRDLKPANVMIGSYGEVYVLDWGIAKVESAAEDAVKARRGREEESTAPGKILGTFGYMSPEQALGKATIDARSDVYSLGAMLFELLTLEPLHHKAEWNAVVFATVKGVSARPSARVPSAEVPPELEEICVQATKVAAAERFESARALHDAVERFLAGDRDVELRRSMAATELRAAEAAVAAAVAGSMDARKAAIAAIGRTLALDPGNETALRVLTDLVTSPPREVPPDVTARVDAQMLARAKPELRDGVLVDVLASVLLVPGVLWMGVRDLQVLATAVVLTAIATLFKLAALRSTSLRRGHDLAYGAYCCNVLSVLFLGRGFGPLFFTPTLLAMLTFAYSMSPLRAYRIRVMVTGTTAFLASMALELLGVIAPSYEFRGGEIVVVPHAVSFPPLQTLSGLIFATVFMIVAPSLMMGRLQGQLRDAEERSHLQMWHLRQLLPDAAQGPVSRR